MVKKKKNGSKGQGKEIYPQIYATIRKRIQDGTYPPGSLLPTQTTLAKRLKVNPLTLSRAMSQLADEGLIVCRRGRGSFVVDPAKAPLLPGRSLKIGLLWPLSVGSETLTRRYLAGLTHGILQEWGLADVAPVIPIVGEDEPTRAIWQAPERRLTVECLGEARSSIERHPTRAAVEAGQYDGIITLDILEEDWLEQLCALERPLVLADFKSTRFTSRLDQAFVDPEPGYHAAVRYFFGQGLRRIHFVGTDRVAPSKEKKPSQEAWEKFKASNRRVEPTCFLRMGMYRQAMEACGISVPQDWIHIIRGRQEFVDQFVENLARRSATERPEAVVTDNVELANRLIEAGAKHGLHLGGAGTCDGESKGPAVRIQADFQELGAVAAELLMLRFQHPVRRAMDVSIKTIFNPPHHEAFKQPKLETVPV